MSDTLADYLWQLGLIECSQIKKTASAIRHFGERHSAKNLDLAHELEDMKPNIWWQRGYDERLRQLAHELRDMKDKAWLDYRETDSSDSQYRLGFYQGILHVLERARHSLNRSEGSCGDEESQIG